MVIDRSKHNKFVGLPEKTTDTGGTTGTSGSGSGDGSTTVIISGGGGTANLDPELIEELRNQEAFSYINISDGQNTILTAAQIEKDYFNLAIQGDGETSETQVSSDKYLPRTQIEATGSIPGSYWVVFNHVQVPDIGPDGEPVYKDIWRIELTKMSPDPAVRPNIDYNGIELIYQGVSQGVYDLSDDRVSVQPTDSGDTLIITINQDSFIDFDTLQLVWTQDANYTPVTTLPGIAIQNYVTVTITQAGATRFWKLDEYGNLYTDYNAYSNLDLGAKGRLWTDTGLYVGNFTQGISGGVFYVQNEQGDTYIEADRMRIRKKAYFETLEIVNVNSVGGKQIISPAGAITVRKVEETTITLDADTLASLNVPDPTQTEREVYRCYFMGEQDGVEVENRWHVGDLAFSQNFNIKTPGTYEQVANHYFWRLVVGVSTEIDDEGNHYIDLDKVDCDYLNSGGDGLLDSDPPHVNDVVAQLGNKNDADRQSALIFSSVDAESPRIILCHGINSYTLSDTEYFDVGVNHSTNQAYTNIYGRAYIGKKDLSSYLRYNPDTESVEILGTLMVGSTYDGKNFADVFVTSENYTSFKDAVTGSIKDIQNQIDGTIEAYFQPYSPTLENEPAVTWINEGKQAEHLGDTFTNIQQYDEEDESTYDAGKSWRWTQSEDGTYGWTQISDSDAVAALKKAAEAQDTADGKRRVFVTQPTQEQAYDIGDLWVNATYPADGSTYKDEILRANAAKQAGYPFSIDHWAPASAYKNLYMEALNQAEAAKDAADAVSDALADYKNTVDSAFADGVITAAEATTLQALAQTITTTINDVDQTYNDVYDRDELMDRQEDGTLTESTEKVNLRNAYNAFHGTAENLVDTVNYIVSNYVNTTFDKNNQYVIDINVYYTQFNQYYKTYIQAINAAQLKITNQIADTKEAQIVDAFAWLNGLFDPDVRALIDGAVIASGIMYVGQPLGGTQYKVNGGFSGINDHDYDIAIWYGGDMIDAETSSDHNDRIAGSLLRYDGSGYFGARWVQDSTGKWNVEYGIKWDKEGIVTVDPATFWVGEAKVDLLLQMFNAVDSNQDGYTDYAEMLKPFQEVRIGSDAYIGYDAVNKSVYVYRYDEATGTREACNFYATGEVTAYGSPYEDESPAYARYVRDLRDVNYGGNVDPDSADTLLMWNGTTWAYINKNDVGLNEAQLEQYLTENEYAKKSDLITNVSWSAITGKPTTLAGYGITDAYTKTESDSRYVNVAGDTMTGALIFNSAQDQLIVLNSEREPYIEFQLNGVRQAVFGGVNNVPAVYTNTWHEIWHAGNDGSGSGLDADMLDGRHRSNLYTNIQDWLSTIENGEVTITINGDANTYYPVVITCCDISKRIYSQVSIYRDLGEQCASYSGNHINGTSSMWIVYDYRCTIWDGNGGFIRTMLYSMPYATLCALTDTDARVLGALIVYLRGGGTVYHIASTGGVNRADVCYSTTNIGSSQYPYNVSPITSLGNIGVCNWGNYYLQTNLAGNASSASKLETPRTIWGQSFDGTNNVSGQLSGCTRVMNANSQPIYLGNADNSSWVYTQDIASHQGNQYWAIRQDGSANFNGNVAIGLTSASYKLHVNGNIYTPNYVRANTMYTDNWFRSEGNTGWYSQTYGGGWYMQDASYIRTYGSKAVHASNNTYYAFDSAGGYHSGWNNSYALNATNLLNVQHGVLNKPDQPVAYNGTCQPMVVWSNQVTGYGYITRYSIASVRQNNGWGSMRLSVGNNDVGTSVGAYIDIHGGGTITVGGNIIATGEVTAYSDARLKNNISPLHYRGRLSPKSYIKDNKQSIGFIAQDVQELYPELVMETGGDNNYLSLNYGNITAVLSAQINQVEDEVITLKNRVQELEYRLSRYETVE